MWWPWHYDQRAADEADERAARDQDERDRQERDDLNELHAEPGLESDAFDWLEEAPPAKVWAAEVSPSGLFVRDAGGVWRLL